MVYKSVKVDIDEKQLNAAKAGKQIRIRPGQIGTGSTFLSLHPANAKIVEKAALKSKGCNIHLSAGELLSTAEDMDGEGLFGDIFKGLKSGYNWVKKNVIDTDLYQKSIKPLVKQVVQKGVQAAQAAATQYAPGVPTGAISDAVESLGRKTGAFGIRTGHTKATRKAKLQAAGLYLS